MKTILAKISGNRRLTLAISLVIVFTVIAQFIPTYSWAVVVQFAGITAGFVTIMTRRGNNDR